MSTKSKECPVSACGGDIVTRALTKVGVCRSMLITLALVPFAWDGVVWCGQAINSLWGLVTNAVG